ncbi:MAG: EAL domain-containing protein [Campylobacterales bacterium]|nr:EAL domain-containing protein [Campylobacterales bacterium]
MMTPLHALRLLYVESQMACANEVLAYLQPICASIEHAATTDQAQASFRLNPHDIVLFSFDVQGSTPVLTCLQAIRDCSAETPIIIIASSMQCSGLFEAMEAGFERFVSKPIDLARLEQRLQKKAHNLLLNRETDRARHLLSEYLKALESSVILSKTDPRGIITYANDAFVEISGYAKEELLGRAHNIIRHPDTSAELFVELWRTIKSGQIWKGIITNRAKDGSSYTVESTIIPILDPSGGIVEFLGIRHDITSMATHTVRLQDVVRENELIAIKRSKEVMARLYTDANTGIPNAQALQRDISYFDNGTLFLLDVNNFNIFNKLHGFLFGDQLLSAIGLHLSHLLRDSEKLYKLSADRFVILAKQYDEEYINYLCNQIFAYFDNTELFVDTIETPVSFSIGVAQITHERDSIIDAEFALDVTKRFGKRFKIIYNKDAEEFMQERESIDWLNRTRKFIYKDMIVPYYQPIVEVSTRRIYKYEALARVIEGDEVIAPYRFLGAAKRLGLLTSITKSMINKTFEQFSGTEIHFSINITERDIMDGYLVEFIKQKAERYHINPRRLTFEVLENLTLSEEGEVVAKTIGLIKDYGCNIAIDDFGSEHSNFGRILSLQSDYLKIDGVFVRDCDTDGEKQKIIDAIVQLARRLGIKTIAEYVSSEAIFETVKALVVDYAQGYLFGQPEPFQSNGTPFFTHPESSHP